MICELSKPAYSMFFQLSVTVHVLFNSLFQFLVLYLVKFPEQNSVSQGNHSYKDQVMDICFFCVSFLASLHHLLVVTL